MDLQLSKEERDIQARAREFAETHLFPHEIECDENEGLSKKSLAEIRKAVIDHGLNGFNHTKEDGGQGFTHFQQILLHETGALPEGKLEAVRAMSQKRGMPFEWAFVMDAMQAERDQGITIDTTQIRFASEKRNYILIDAPGHREFLKNMVSGAASAESLPVQVNWSDIRVPRKPSKWMKSQAVFQSSSEGT